MMDKALCALDRFLKNEIYRNHPDINAGGCCVFAALLANYLMQTTNVRDVRIRINDYADYDSDAISRARELVRGNNNVYAWNEAGVGFNHVALEFKYKGTKYHCDAKGVRGPIFHFLKGFLTYDEAFELGDNPAGWNKCFNRREIPTIKKRLRKFFNEHVKKGVRSRLLVA